MNLSPNVSQLWLNGRSLRGVFVDQWRGFILVDFNFIGLDEIWAEVFSHRKLERECRRYRLWDFPGDPVFRMLPVLGTWAQSLVQELRSHTPAKKKKKKARYKPP